MKIPLTFSTWVFLILTFIFQGCVTTENDSSYIDENELADTTATGEIKPLTPLKVAPPAPETTSQPVSTPTPAPNSDEISSPKVEEVAPPTPAPISPAPTTSAAELKPTVAPASIESFPYKGKIVLVDEPKKFVVIDFQESKLPPTTSELGVYREGKFVGSVRITPPAKLTLTTADVLTGTLRLGDEVR